MRSYFYGDFRNQLKMLDFQRPNSIIREFMRDDNIIFFGFQDWKNVVKDLSLIPKKDKSKFVFSLFMIILIDQCLYRHWKEAYPDWRKKTNFPKFGWAGFGLNNENPLKILWAPERDNIIDVNEMLRIMPNFIKFMHEEVEGLLPMPISSFFQSIKNDYALNFDEGEIVKNFKLSLINFN